MNSISKSLWTTINNAGSNPPSDTDLVLFAPLPGTNLVTNINKCSVADLVAGGISPIIPGMSTYLPQTSDGNGDPVVWDHPQVMQFWVVGDVMTVLVDLQGKLPAMTDASFLELDLPQPIVTDVIVDSLSGTSVFTGNFFTSAGDACICEIDVVDGIPSIFIVPTWSVAAITAAITNLAADFAVDPTVVNIRGLVSFQFV